MKNTKNPIRSKVLKLAHSIKSNCANFGEAQSKAWKVIKIKAQMQNSIVTFTFIKSNGELTTRIATKLDSFLPQPKLTTQIKNKVSNKVTFWSITDNGFRAFLPENIVSIDSVESLPNFAYNLLAA